MPTPPAAATASAQIIHPLILRDGALTSDQLLITPRVRRRPCERSDPQAPDDLDCRPVNIFDVE